MAGNVSVSPTVTTTYTVTCSGAGGSATNSATVTVSTGSGSVPTDGSGTQAKTANAFLDTLGVNIHMAYPTYSNVAQTETQLKFIGFRYARDFAGISSVPVLRQLNTDLGTKFNMYLPVGWGTDTATALNLMKQNSDILVSAEGYNEPDNWPPAGGDAQVVSDQRLLYSTLKGYAATANTPIYTFSVGNAEANGSRYGNVAASTDYTTAHTYPAGGYLPYTITQSWDNYSLTWAPNKPITITEGGFSSFPDTTASVDVTSQAKAELNYVFDTFVLGVHKTYLYELINEQPEGTDNNNREWNFGLFYNNGSAKPVATAFHNLTTLLADTATFSTGMLNYSLSSMPSSAHQTLLQKGDGTFVLVLWNEAIPQWGGGASTNNVNISLNLAVAAKSVTIYDPTVGTSATGSVGTTGGTISLPDHPILVFIKK